MSSIYERPTEIDIESWASEREKERQGDGSVAFFMAMAALSLFWFTVGIALGWALRG